MKATIFASVLLAACFQYGEAGNLVLIEFNTDNYDSVLVQLEQMESRGITPRHIFAPNWVIADLHQVPPEVVTLGGGNNIHC